MPFQINIDEQLNIEGTSYYVCAHPAIPGYPFIQEGQSSRVVQLRSTSGFVALKVQSHSWFAHFYGGFTELTAREE